MLAEALSLLSTPSATFTHVPDAEKWQPRREANRRKGINGNGFGLTLPMAVQLMEAIQSTGESTNPPSDAGKKPSGAPRLSPWFVEWMMGAPEGWTDPDCPLSAMEFSSKPDGSSGDT